MIRCLTILNDVKDRLRATIADMVAVHDTDTGPRPRSPFPVLANFPGEGYNDRDVQKATLVHLDTIVGDVRHMQSVVRYLGKLMMNRTFAEQLDVRHEHLIPFTNGVLDLDRLVLRDGRPEDMLLRGPTYPWCDFPASDPDTEELERMLTQVFTEEQVLRFFLEVGATWLRRRNRFKHFYVFTGNTNDRTAVGQHSRTADRSAAPAERACCSTW
jgi:phage/plasmid-associated DNA primase